MASDLKIGHEGAGGNCFDKAVGAGGKGLVAGAAFGAVEACFLPQARGSTTPMLFRALSNIGSRSFLGGAVLSTFTAAACLSAKYRDKDDYKNAFVGGSLAGSIFGILARSIPLTIGLSLGVGTAMAIIKFQHNVYFPPLPAQWATLDYPDMAWREGNYRQR